MELPPRARRIPRHRIFLRAGIGTTSAHAENTGGTGHGSPRIRNYLRARGEYILYEVNTENQVELPPHTRRIRQLGRISPLGTGTTSAYAENTLHWGRDRLPTGRFLASSRRTHSCVRCGFWGYPIALEDLIPDFI